MHHRIRPIASTGLTALAASVAIVLPAGALAGGSHRVAHHASHRRSVHHSSGIPQHNGGDHDSDNNGGPSDGDGNV